MKTMVAALVSVGILLGVPAYADNLLVGSGLGAAVGAVVGHQVDHDNGAWVGGAVGALTGAAISSNNNTVRYVERDPYAYDYRSYDNTPRRDVYVVQPGYYERPPVNVIYVDADRGHRNHHHRHHERHYDHHRGYGHHNQGYREGRNVVIVR